MRFLYNKIMENIKQAAEIIKNAKRGAAFTGAGVSVESGIPPFTGAGGLWNKYDPKFIELDFFYAHPEDSWKEMKKIFFSSMGSAKPNKAHEVIARLERRGLIRGVITQNIDGLHQAAGSQNVQEFHGAIHTLSCTRCLRKYQLADVDLDEVPPRCFCGGVLKPDFVFYGEGINPRVYAASQRLAQEADVMIVVGTAGQVMPACSLPLYAKQNGAKIIEINTLPSAYTDTVSDLYFPVKATEFFEALAQELKELLGVK